MSRRYAALLLQLLLGVVQPACGRFCLPSVRMGAYFYYPALAVKRLKKDKGKTKKTRGRKNVEKYLRINNLRRVTVS